MTALMWAAAEGHVQVCKVLLKAGQNSSISHRPNVIILAVPCLSVRVNVVVSLCILRCWFVVGYNWSLVIIIINCYCSINNNNIIIILVYIYNIAYIV